MINGSPADVLGIPLDELESYHNLILETVSKRLGCITKRTADDVAGVIADAPDGIFDDAEPMLLMIIEADSLKALAMLSEIKKMESLIKVLRGEIKLLNDLLKIKPPLRIQG